MEKIERIANEPSQNDELWLTVPILQVPSVTASQNFVKESQVLLRDALESSKMYPLFIQGNLIFFLHK